MSLGTILDLVKIILDLEARMELLLKGIQDEKRRDAIRKAILARDVDAINKLIMG